MATVFGGEPPSPARRWVVIGVATVLLQFSYWPTVGAIMQADRVDPVLDAALMIGLASVPFVLAVLAFASRHPQAPQAVLRAMGLFLLVGLPLGLLHVAIGMTAGYSAAGVAALRAGESADSRRLRVIAVIVVTVCVTLMMVGAPEVAVALGALLPFTALGAADALAGARERRGT